MRTVKVTRRAAGDLDDVAEYSVTVWGDDGASYFDGLTAACLEVAAIHESLWRPVEGYPQLRRVRYEMHNVYFRVKPRQIELVRVLHASMDPSRYL